MKSINDFRNIISDNKLKVVIKENFINITNYDEIITLESEKIILKSDSKKIKIIGKNLTLIKLLDSEILVEGFLRNIEFSE